MDGDARDAATPATRVDGDARDAATRVERGRLARAIGTGVMLTLPNPGALSAWVAVAAALWPTATVAEAIAVALGVGVGSAAWFTLLGWLVATLLLVGGFFVFRRTWSLIAAAWQRAEFEDEAGKVWKELDVAELVRDQNFLTVGS